MKKKIDDNYLNIVTGGLPTPLSPNEKKNTAVDKKEKNKYEKNKVDKIDTH